MPRFMDFHPELTRVPIPQRNELLARRDRGEEDEFGVLPLNILFGLEKGVYCLNRAPDAEAVVRAHAGVGIPPPDSVTEVTSLLPID